MEAIKDEYAYLTMTAGEVAGAQYRLDEFEEVTIGRGTDCYIVLTDPLCSRIHAVLVYVRGQWCVRDQSRNGTYVNGQVVDDAVLADEHRLRVGSTEFLFQISDQPPTTLVARSTGVAETLVQDALVDSHDSLALSREHIRKFEHTQDLLLLHQLTLKLLAQTDANDVVHEAMQVLKDRTSATVVGFLSLGDDGQFKLKLVLPKRSAQHVSLSSGLTRKVREEGKAVWIANQTPGKAIDSLEHFADALCVPLLHEGKVLGAIHVYLQSGRFRPAQFDFAIGVANVTSVALVRARREQRNVMDLARLKADSGRDGIVGDSPSMLDLKSKIERVAGASSCALIRGESGVGKELVARALHTASPRADRPMISVNCAAIAENLMESQLFGHKAGSFTGADRDHAGFFQQADLGTLFLDEVGELTLQGQSKLLRILEGHPFMPVGSTQQVQVDVRVIAATNQDLQTFVQQKRFREDLYYRLSVFELFVPPLRDRGDDVPLLTDFFLDHFRQHHGRPALELSEAARAKLLNYTLARQMFGKCGNVMDSAVLLASGDQIEEQDLALRDTGGKEFESLRLADWEERLIREALQRTAGNVVEAAKLLGIGRATLYRKLDEYKIPR